jgi:ribosomal protein S18 acetylase RimI-like enzyme
MVKVEPARAEDAERLAVAHVAAWQWAYRELLPHDFLATLDVARRVSIWREALATSANRVWLGLEGGVLVGFAATSPSRDPDAAVGTGELGALYVLEASTRRGVGHALLSASVSDLEERGFRPITLWAFDDNARALAFYERHGWRRDGASRVEIFSGKPMREVRLRLGRP